MYYRRKLLLGLLESLNRTVPRVDLQKYLFLLCNGQESPAYDFVPFRYGCFSFQADADKRTLTKYGAIRDSEAWSLGARKRYLHLLRSADRDLVSSIVASFGNVRGRDLVRYVYRSYPYYAINSEVRYELLDSRELAEVEDTRPAPKSAGLLTIGYEGQSLEKFLNKLIQQSVSVLCDVRRNPVSMKYGFSKRQLKGAVEGLGMEYVHMPELGIESRKRRDIESPADYELLFQDYIQNTLHNATDALNRITNLVLERGRVALTCFESHYTQCHRGCIAEALSGRPDFRHQIVHL